MASPQPITPTNSLTVVMDYFSHTKKKDRAQSPAPSSPNTATPDERDVHNDGSINHPNSGNAIQPDSLSSIDSAGSDERPTNSLVLSSSTTEREGLLPLNRTTNSLTQNNKTPKLNLNARKTGGIYSKSAPSSPLIKRFNVEPFPFETPIVGRNESEKINKIQNDPLMKFVTSASTITSSSTHDLSKSSEPQQKQTLHPQTSSPPPRHSQKSSTTLSRPVIIRSGTSLNTGANPSPFIPIPPLPPPPSLAKLKQSREGLRKVVADEKIGGNNEIERPDGIINGSGEEKGEK